jgi:hypothetical protein
MAQLNSVNISPIISTTNILPIAPHQNNIVSSSSKYIPVIESITFMWNDVSQIP